MNEAELMNLVAAAVRTAGGSLRIPKKNFYGNAGHALALEVENTDTDEEILVVTIINLSDVPDFVPEEWESETG